MRQIAAISLLLVSGFGNGALAQGFAQQTVAPGAPAAPAPTQTPVVAPAAVATPAPVAPAPSAPDASGKYKLREGEDVNLQFAQDPRQ
jgi:hypothetical protein